MTRKEAVTAYINGTSGSLLVGLYIPAPHFDLWTFTEIYRLGIFFLGAFLMVRGFLWFYKNMNALWISD
jgi:drug/metabolite transporter (DMT)-like permease